MRACCSQQMAVPFSHHLSSEKAPSPSALATPPPPPPNVAMAPPSLPPPTQDDLKRVAAHRAVELVEPGMVLGLGTGSTAAHALDRIGELIRRGDLRGVVGIPTSRWAEARAAAAGIPLSDLGAHPVVDISIDGADEVDPGLNLVKGRGGSLLREKMVEGASRRFVVIVDETKLVRRIGASDHAVPVEVVPFGWQLTLARLRRVFEGHESCEARLRRGGEGEPFVTDNGNYIVDLFFDKERGIERDLREVSDQILRVIGVVEHGMFLGMASSVIVAGTGGVTELLP
uniref:ribose-5-phosphate isomerase n=1 Tax=Anthurium amnicola TaxID=1678845 RepID=A0A1D1XUD6_9ARAE